MTRFATVLVANRGEIARRVFRTARSMGLRTVAVFVDADADAPFVTDADQAIRIPSYLDTEALIAAMTTAVGDDGPCAVHPGYGFLSENGAFAKAVEAAGHVWVGPSPESIKAMGDKIEAKRLAVKAGVPVLPSSEDPATFASVGFPLLIKAAAGGGGKGMRIVESADELDEAVASAKREALSGFGDDRVFAERYVPKARHIEIQLLGDGHGNLVHLGERECSIQRRHQKVIEEAPSPFVSAELRAEMGEAAIRLGAVLGYRSAGTVEFLVDAVTGNFHFLEVNTRLQVEHPVTEEVTGRDLVRDQLRIATGEPLGFTQDDVEFSGHAIEARLYAEDPDNGFLPAIGTLTAFDPAPEPNLRWDSGVVTGSKIGVDFDPMVAKVVAVAATRTEAAGRLALGLEGLHIGGVVTNRDFLAATLRTPEFLDGDTTTDFIERVAPATTKVFDEAALAWRAMAAALWVSARHRDEAGTLSSIPSGYVIGRLPPERLALMAGDRRLTVHYRFNRDGTASMAVGDESPLAPELASFGLVHRWWSGGIDAEIDGRRRVLRLTRSDGQLQVTGDGGGTTFEVMPRFAPPEAEIPGGAVAAPMPGTILELRVDVGQTVTAGQVVAVLEAMKMENHLSAAEDGVVTEVRVAVGEQVGKDTLLLVIEPTTGGGQATEVT